MGKAATGSTQKHQSKASVSRISTSSGSETNYYDFPIIPTKSRSRSPEQSTMRSSDKPAEIPEYSEVDPGNPLGNAVDLIVNTVSFVTPEIGMGSVLKPYTTCQDKDLQKFLEDCLLLDHTGRNSKKSDDKSTTNVSQTSSGKRSKHGWRNNKFILKRKKSDGSLKDDDDLWKGIIDKKEGDVDDIITISMSDDDTLFIDLEEDNTWTTFSSPEDRHQNILAIDISKVVASKEKIKGTTKGAAPSTSESHHLDEENVKEEAKEPENIIIAQWQVIEAFFATNNASKENQTEPSPSNATAKVDIVEETKKEEPESIANEKSSTSNDSEAPESDKTTSRKQKLRSSILALSSRTRSNSSHSKNRKLSWKKVKFLKVIRKARSSSDSIASDEDFVSTDENTIADDKFSGRQDKSGESLQNSVSEEGGTDLDSKHSEGQTIETPSQSSTTAAGLPVWTLWFFNMNMNQNEENDEDYKDDSGSQSLIDSQPFEDTTCSGTDDNTKDSGTILSDNDTNHDSWIMSIDQLASFSGDESRKTEKSDDSSSTNSSCSSSEFADRYQQNMKRKNKSKKGFRRLSETLRRSFSSIKKKNSMTSKRSIESANLETEPTLPSKNIVTVVTNQVTNTASTVGQMKNKLHKRNANNSMCEASTASASSNSQSWTRDDSDTQPEAFFYGFSFFQCHEVIRE